MKQNIMREQGLNVKMESGTHMNRWMRLQKLDKIFIFSLVVLFSACSTSELRVESNPAGADVVVIDNSKSPKKVGVTPLVLSRDNTPQLFNNPIQVNLTKDGYK